ncbi:FkbM family methyltransferase [Flavivirga spongiicola]|uniref:FkbM family methyltransferase n=1 Tax=Flavivirga spongiicola TaxID=421621 RepID=A0ABU7XMK4_9FLAO|nr:FkbM family methyltransferase [Flavivirga sp. MEBiC05379]MDO5981661.1 FkbM family methyltransferase [Flavivirga sp. MEBiC05379]
MKQFLKKYTPSFIKTVFIKLKRIRHFFKYDLLNFKLFICGVYFTHFVKTYRSNGVNIKIPFDLTDYKFRGRFVLNKYESEESILISKYLNKNSTVLELGSCLGYISCITNNILANKTNHVVLEANPNLINSIEENKSLNNCKFHLENKIISKNKSNIFYIHNRIVGGSIVRSTNSKISIEGVGMDYLEKKYSLVFDTLIMDIEGGELDFFRNHKNEILKFKNVFFEIHPFCDILTVDEAKECENILQNLGFELVDKIGFFLFWKNKNL